ncbi:hypothetical protein [Chryseobacterium indologenes]|uniref:hypothetical protein n=1 Tax=Chryseobacterium indologenes TaxID=253 RepID=UPI00076E366C|nr:hypothetical protein [Chryseobacterium indologenes]
MKNLKKIKRTDLKLLIGGVKGPSGEVGAGEDYGEGGNGRALFKCCTGYGCSSCVWGDWLNSYCLNGYLTPC